MPYNSRNCVTNEHDKCVDLFCNCKCHEDKEMIPCDNCGIHPFKLIDVRKRKKRYVTTKSCLYCYRLDTKNHDKVREEELDPKKLLPTGEGGR